MSGRNGAAHPSRFAIASGKYNIWEGGVRVPFYMQWTGHLTTGQVVGTPAGFIDAAPTILKIAPGRSGQDGRHGLAQPAGR